MNFLKVVGAPFEFNGRLWNDDPTRILKLEDYSEGTSLHPMTFPNDVVILEPTQMMKPIFWELTGFRDWHQVNQYIKHNGTEIWGAACYHLRYGPASGHFHSRGHLIADIWRARSNTCEDFMNACSGSYRDFCPVERLYNPVEENVMTENQMGNGSVRRTVFFEAVAETTDSQVIHIQQFRELVIAVETEHSNVPVSPVYEADLKCGTELNYTADVTSQLSGFLTTNKDKNASVFLGLELEVSTDISVAELQYIVQHYEPKQEAFFACKHDGSVDTSRDYAYEIVTVPMTPARMRQEFRILFNKLHELCKKKGIGLSDVFLSSNKNGLHIHISKKAFEGDTRELRKVGNAWGSKFLAAFNSDFMQEIRLLSKVAKRADYTKNSYCGLGNSDARGKRVAYRVGAKHLSLYTTKYTPAHGNKSKTYEVRLFAGLVDLDHVLCSIDMVEAMFYYTGCHGAPLCVRFADTFKAWLVTQNGYRALKNEILKK